MATLTPDDISDIIKTTLRELGRQRWTDLTSDYQHHVAFRQLMRRSRVEFVGYGIQWDVMVAHNDSAQNVGLFNVDNVNIPDVMQQATVAMRGTTANFGFDLAEPDMNAGAAQIVNLVATRRAASRISFAEKFEQNFWQKPADSTDKVKPFGVAYWIVYNATTGFNGGNPTGFTSGAGGLSSTTYPRWRNFSGQYTDVTKTDLIRKAREGATKTNFIPPIDVPDFNTGNQYGWYTNYAVLGKMEELLESQNQNLGNDLASKDGRTMLASAPVVYVPYLDGATGDPLFGINWGVFKTAFLRGWFMRETGVAPAPNQHTVMVAHTDSRYNFKCYDRRRLIGLATADWGTL
jgi:hypothetical protein